MRVAKVPTKDMRCGARHASIIAGPIDYIRILKGWSCCLRLRSVVTKPGKVGVPLQVQPFRYRREVRCSWKARCAVDTSDDTGVCILRTAREIEKYRLS
jgi:hypothetical protein